MDLVDDENSQNSLQLVRLPDNDLLQPLNLRMKILKMKLATFTISGKCFIRILPRVYHRRTLSIVALTARRLPTIRQKLISLRVVTVTVVTRILLQPLQFLPSALL